MSTLLWILFGVLLYTTAVMALDARGLLPSSLSVSGPILTVHTKRGRAFLNWLATPRRFWRAWGNLGVGAAIVVMVGSFIAVLLSAVSILLEPSATTGFVRPQDALVIPGVNQFLPWTAAADILVGLVVGLVVHEGGHGLLCRVEDIDIDSMGIALLALIPLGAFVQPDEASQESADRGSKVRMFAAGVTNNFLVTALAFGLLFAIVANVVAVAPGVAVGGVLPGSAADDADVERGDVLTAVNGQPVETEREFDAALAGVESREVTVDRRSSAPVSVERTLTVTRAVVDAPLETGTTIRTVDGESVYTESAFQAALDGTSVVEIGTENGTVRLPVGVFVSTVPDGDPLSSSGAPDTPMLVHSVNGKPTPTPDALSSVLSNTTPGQTVEVVAYHDGTDPWNGERHVYEVELGEHPRESYGYLGVGGIQQGTSGVVVDDFGIDRYPAEQYHALLGGSGWGEDPLTTFVSRTFALLVLPFASIVDPTLGYNFAGFNGAVTNFYEVSGPLGAGAVFALANVLFWTGWINVNLGLFNCIPSYPLDGGHILRSCVDATLSRLPVAATPTMASAVTTAISVAMILSLLSMLFVPQLL